MDGYSQYQQNNILTASPAKLLLAAYDGAIRFARIGKEKMREGNIADQSVNINKCLSIVCELMSTLKEDANPSLVSRLKSLYLYMIEKLAHANLNNEEAGLDEVIKMLVDLRQTWAEAERIVQRETDMEAAA